MAENSQIPGIREAIANVHQSRDEAERLKAQDVAAKTAETLRRREEKAADAQRIRDEKTAETQRLREIKTTEAQRLREEKAAAKLDLNATPVMQTGVINLSDAFEEDAVQDDNSAASPAVNSANEAGFYADPEGVAPFRYWDGKAWTSRVRMTK